MTEMNGVFDGEKLHHCVGASLDKDGQFYSTACGKGVRGNHDWPASRPLTAWNVCQTCVAVWSKTAIGAVAPNEKCPWCGHPDREEHGIQVCAHRIREERDALLLEKRQLSEDIRKLSHSPCYDDETLKKRLLERLDACFCDDVGDKPECPRCLKIRELLRLVGVDA